MSRVVLAVFVVAVLVLGAAALILGAFPPHPHTEQVQRVLQNDRFGNKP